MYSSIRSSSSCACVRAHQKAAAEGNAAAVAVAVIDGPDCVIYVVCFFWWFFVLWCAEKKTVSKLLPIQDAAGQTIRVRERNAGR